MANELFSQADLDGFLRMITNAALSAVKTTPEGRIRANAPEVAQQILKSQGVNAIAIDEGNIEVTRPKEQTIKWHENGASYEALGLRCTVSIPYTGTPQLFEKRPSENGVAPKPPGWVNGPMLMFDITGADLTADSINTEIAGRVRRINEYIPRVNRDVKAWQAGHAAAIREAVDARAKVLKSSDSIADGLNYRVAN